jgi:hypothetical protein
MSIDSLPLIKQMSTIKKREFTTFRQKFFQLKNLVAYCMES